MPIAILGAGSWGTAVAVHLAHAQHKVKLWSHNESHSLEMQAQRMNSRYLPTINFPPSLQPTADLEECLKQATLIIIAVPSHAFSSLLQRIPLPPQAGIAWLTKGLDPNTNSLLSSLIGQRWGKTYPMAMVTGPSFATEVANQLPTALTLASNNELFQQTIQGYFHYGNVRVYLSDDLIGAQLAGAVKNVLAIACGISDGLGFGANAKAALITRGLSEMSRLGLALGAREESFIGLAGLGDLVLTCTDNQSRNRRFGLQLGQGVSLIDAEKTIGQVVEGKHNASQVCYLARQYNIDMPICMQIDALLKEVITPHQAVINLMTRDAKKEFPS